MRHRTRALCLVLLLGCGCPQQPNRDEPSSKPTPPPIETPTPPPAEPDRPTAGPSGPSGPAGPLGGNLDDRTPDPGDGKTQLDLRPTQTLKVGRTNLETWIVDGPKSRQLGLMHVREMPSDRGMLFIYPDAKRRSFWMQNTYVPLSLAYIAADGKIEQILDMKPLTRTSHPSKSAVRFVLEVNQGWFAKSGVAVGDTVHGISGLRGF